MGKPILERTKDEILRFPVTKKDLTGATEQQVLSHLRALGFGAYAQFYTDIFFGKKYCYLPADLVPFYE